MRPCDQSPRGWNRHATEVTSGEPRGEHLLPRNETMRRGTLKRQANSHDRQRPQNLDPGRIAGFALSREWCPTFRSWPCEAWQPHEFSAGRDPRSHGSCATAVAGHSRGSRTSAPWKWLHMGLEGPSARRMKPHWRASNGEHRLGLRAVGFRARERSHRIGLEHACRLDGSRVRSRVGGVDRSPMDRFRRLWGVTPAFHGQGTHWEGPPGERQRNVGDPLKRASTTDQSVSPGPGGSHEEGRRILKHAPFLQRPPNSEGTSPRIRPFSRPPAMKRGLRDNPVVGEEV